MISVIIPTCRVGGLDVVIDGLAGQSEKDFELVLADGVYHYRRMPKKIPFEIQHIDAQVSFEHNEYCKTINKALKAAKGEIFLFLTDYSWLPPEFISIHKTWHEQNPGNVMCLSNPHRYSGCPEMAPNFPKYGQKDVAKYESDLKTGKLKTFGTSIFEPHFSSDTIVAKPDYVVDIDSDGMEVKSGGADPKDSRGPGGMDPILVHLKGESVKREMLETVRHSEECYFPEELDGGHGYQDSWFGFKTARHGAQWVLTRDTVVWIPQVRDKFPRMPRTRSFVDQEALMKTLL